MAKVWRSSILLRCEKSLVHDGCILNVECILHAERWGNNQIPRRHLTRQGVRAMICKDKERFENGKRESRGR